MKIQKKHFALLPLMLGFILGCHKEYIALWEEGAAEPRQVFPYKITVLPPSDQEMLKKGIHVKTIEELSQLVEDYLS